MKTSSIAVETSRSTSQSDSIVRQTNKRSFLSDTTMNNIHIFNDKFATLYNIFVRILRELLGRSSTKPLNIFSFYHNSKQRKKLNQGLIVSHAPVTLSMQGWVSTPHLEIGTGGKGQRKEVLLNLSTRTILRTEVYSNFEKGSLKKVHAKIPKGIAVVMRVSL